MVKEKFENLRDLLHEYRDHLKVEWDNSYNESISIEIAENIIRTFISLNYVINNLNDMISASKKGLAFDWEDHVTYFINDLKNKKELVK